MATESDTGENGNGMARKLLVPVAISAVGSAVGFLLTKKQDLRAVAPKLRDAVSDLPRPHMPEGSVGDLTDDLRGKVESVLGKDSSAVSSEDSTGPIDRSKLEQRRRARQQRRNQRRRSRS